MPLVRSAKGAEQGEPGPTSAKFEVKNGFALQALVLNRGGDA